MHDVMVDGVTNEIASGRTLVDGTGYDIVMGRTLVNGTGYDINLGIQIGKLPIGSSVFGVVNGVKTEFLVVHHGNPDTSIYDASCDGTWLLMKDGYEQSAFKDEIIDGKREHNSYARSDIHAKLNGAILEAFDEGFQDVIKDIKIPWTHTTFDPEYVNHYISDGLETKLFVLSCIETGGFQDVILSCECPRDGAILDYFIPTNGHDEKRVAKFNGTYCGWYLRSPAAIVQIATGYVLLCNCGGSIAATLAEANTTGWNHINYPLTIRPACIVPSDTLVKYRSYEIIT